MSSPIVANGVVYVVSGGYDLWKSSGADLFKDGNLYALNATTGQKLWVYQTGRIYSSSPTVANGVVYVDSGDGNLYALEATTGQELWAFQAGGGIVNASLPVVNGVVYIDGYDGNLYALNAMTGQKLWAYYQGVRQF